MEKIKINGNIGRVYEYMRTHKGITSIQAFEMFGATRLSAIIYDLKNRHGLNIESESKTGKNRYGEPVRFVQYRLVKE